MQNLLYLIKKPYIRTPLVLIVLFALLILAKEFYNIVPLENSSKWNKDQNGIWLSRHWLREPISNMPDDELRQILSGFKERGIRYLFPHVCPMDEQGHLPEVNEERTARLLNISKEYEDYFQIMPWVGGSIATVDLSNASQRAVWVDEVKGLVEEYDFPGVNVNIEPLEHGDDRILGWMRDLRTALGEQRIISFCGIRPESKPRKNDNFGIWTAEDYENMAALVDQIAVMSYDTGRKLPFLYVRWNSTQFANVLRAVEKGGSGKCQLLWGIPVYEDRANYFDPNSENIRTAFHGLTAGLRNSKNNSIFSGVAIYSGWTIDHEEWEEYDRCWLGK